MASRSVRYLEALRGVLAHDHLSRGDLTATLRGLAAAAEAIVGACRAFVALVEPDSGEMRAVTATGELAEAERAAALGTVRQACATGLPSRNEGLLAVPFRLWDLDSRTVRGAGSLCARRNEPFDADDLQALEDVARLAEPILTIVLHAQRPPAEPRPVSRHPEVTSAARLGSYETRDAAFAAETIATLQRAAGAGKVGLLILGPTGSGKTHLARAFHEASSRRKGPFVTFDAAQVTSAETMAAELFGYAPASGYSNAPPKGRPGKAELADGGMLFLDEVSVLPAELQQRLLRLIQAGTYAPLGTSEERQVDVQVLAASNEDLRALVKRGRFREDLFWRLSELSVRLPPLSRRPADVPDLADRFLAEARARFSRPELVGFTDDALDALVAHDWSRSGNVRGLQQTVSRSVLLAPAGTARIGSSRLGFESLKSSAELTPVQLPASSRVRAAVPRRGIDREDRDQARGVLIRKIVETHGTIARMGEDPEVSRACGYDGPVPDSSLLLILQELGLESLLSSERRWRDGTLDEDLSRLKEAIRRHGSGTAAAKALGITRDALVWRLRRAGLTIEIVLSG